jgi:two-component system sensor histidine kinase HupT/HoxJ
MVPGTGLGLSIAQQIARTHGGHIAVANRDGGGCVVTVSLPAVVW